MNTNIKLVVFDMAGTTIDEDNLVYKTIQKSLAEHGVDISLAQVLHYGAGKEKQQAIHDVLTNCSAVEHIEELTYRVFKQFKTNLAKAYDDFPAKPIPGVEQLFQNLRKAGIKVCLNTGYNAQTTATLLKQVGWETGKTVDAIVNADDVERARPFPDMILKAMELLQITDASEVLKAGDSATDIMEGKNAGCGLTIGVLTGAQTSEQLQVAAPDYILNSLTELHQIILN